MYAIKAKWIIPVTSSPIHGGAVIVNGPFIHSVVTDSEVNQLPDLPIVDLGNSIILPGLINSHAHLNYSNSLKFGNAKNAHEILEGIAQARRSLTRSDVVEAVRGGVGQMLQHGITTVVTAIDRRYLDTVDICISAGLRVYALVNVKFGKPTFEELSELLDYIQAVNIGQEGLAVGLLPHSIYRVPYERLRQLGRFAQRRSIPLSIHLSEFPEERQYFDCMADLNVLPDTFVTRGLAKTMPISITKYTSPIVAAADLGILGKRTLAVHCIHVDQDDIRILKQSGASVVVCPTSSMNIGTGIAPIAKLEENGVNVCLGTDSAATCQTYDLFDDMRIIYDELCRQRVGRSLAAYLPLRYATLNAAKALGRARDLGSIERGKLADLIALPGNCLDLAKAEGIYDVILGYTGKEVVLRIVSGKLIMNSDIEDYLTR